MATPAAGDRAWLVRLQRGVKSTSALNNPVTDWSDLATVWAAKYDISDGERFGAGEVAAEITTRWRIDWSPEVAGLGADDRLVHDDDGRERVYAILGVKELGRREGLEITTAARGEGA